MKRESPAYSSLERRAGAMNLADYRRFVSYIYAYRNGKKEKNTGFAKVEARISENGGWTDVTLMVL